MPESTLEMATTPRNILVIGNSDGIGLGLTRRLLAAGCIVTGVSRREAPLSSMQGKESKRDKTGMEGYEHAVLDVASPDYRSALEAVERRRGPFDVCVYCAGIGNLFNPRDLSNEAQVFRVNLLGAVETAEILLPGMIGKGAGHFVALSSIADDSRSGDAPSYNASKAGLSTYLSGLALALRPHGVYVTNVRFGFVDTKMAKSPVRPMMISVERAVDVIMGCLEKRPAQLTFPKRMGMLVRVLRWLTSLRIWFS